ncbi:MAG: NUDIX domain-containing protein [Clostridia bacterium]|nr:NUDIX domain-containing protein [Clostridia bacterium]
MDIVLKTENGRFNYRVAAIILKDNKLLAMRDEVSKYFYLIGGKIELHETAENAILREIKEEMGVNAEIIRPLWICQNFFTEDTTKDKFHELCFYFLVDISKTDILSRGNSFVQKEGKHTLTFEWIDINKLKDKYFYPEFVKREIFNLPHALTLITEYEN